MGGPEVSHGRGGAGNINPDDTKYVDGEIVRAGTEGPQGAGAYSTGRGGTFDMSGFCTCSVLQRRETSSCPQGLRAAFCFSPSHGRDGNGEPAHAWPGRAANGKEIPLLLPFVSLFPVYTLLPQPITSAKSSTPTHPHDPAFSTSDLREETPRMLTGAHDYR
jgi:hypothetical protein